MIPHATRSDAEALRAPARDRSGKPGAAEVMRVARGLAADSPARRGPPKIRTGPRVLFHVAARCESYSEVYPSLIQPPANSKNDHHIKQREEQRSEIISADRLKDILIQRTIYVGVFYAD